MEIYLEKIDPDTNCFRFYEIRTMPDLFDESALVVHWGRIGRAGRTQIRGGGSRQDCESLGAQILKLRLQHGYEVKSEVDPALA